MEMTRREFMLCAGGLGFSVLLEGCAAVRPDEKVVLRDINAWASLASDGTVYIVNPAVEMGQGSMTAIPRTRCRRLGSPRRCRNAATASPARS